MKKISNIPNPLFILEMANNHMGDVKHAKRLISEYAKICSEFNFEFAFKLQYRNLDTFIHPKALKDKNSKYIKRFLETKLELDQFNEIIKFIRKNNFYTMATPFDEKSVDTIESQNLNFIKIASCSFNDWPLLERISQSDLPIIASTAGAKVDDIDKVVTFMNNREKDFALLHCVGEYPTPDKKMHMSQIDYLRKLYPNVKIGFSTHENPSNYDFIRIAIAKGATIFEKHVGLKTPEYSLNNYSSSPEQFRLWLESAKRTFDLCGIGDKRLPKNNNELKSLHSLRRGIFARKNIKPNQLITSEDIYYAFPPEEDSYTANDWSKHKRFYSNVPIKKNKALNKSNINIFDDRSIILNIAKKVNKFLSKANIIFPGESQLEISHHYGLEKFDKYGLVLITVVNRDYCKKILVSFPNQKHPEQYHQKKEETFHILYGNVTIKIDQKIIHAKPGDVVTVKPKNIHSWVSNSGSIIEEISSTHFKDDSFYLDNSINLNKNRKTVLTYWIK